MLRLKENEWLGLEVVVSNKVARIYGAQRLGGEPEGIEVRRNGGAVLVRIRPIKKGEKSETLRVKSLHN